MGHFCLFLFLQVLKSISPYDFQSEDIYNTQYLEIIYVACLKAIPEVLLSS